MGVTGPIPKRSEERRRRNARTEAGESTEPETLEAEGEVEVPNPAGYDEWHAISQNLWDSVVASAFTRFYEPSDWAVLELTCESLSRDLSEQSIGITDKGDVVRDTIPLKGASLSAYSKVFATLLLTDGDRRRLRLDIQRKDAVEQAVKTSEDIVKDRRSLFAIEGGKS